MVLKRSVDGYCDCFARVVRPCDDARRRQNNVRAEISVNKS